MVFKDPWYLARERLMGFHSTLRWFGKSVSVVTVVAAQFALISSDVVASTDVAANAASVTAQPKPFRRVLVLSGGGLNSAIALGVVEGLQNKGWSPDLIIATCGSAIPAAILKAKGNLEDAKNFLYGDDYRKLIQSVAIERPITPLIAKSIYLDSSNNVPDIFGTPVLRIPMEWPKSALDQDFTKKFDDIQNAAPAIAIISGHAYFGPANSGSRIKGRKLIRESFFTDSRTGYVMSQNLLGSPIAQNFPMSHVDGPIEIRTDLKLFEAARGSVSDPYLIAPFPNPSEPDSKNDYYMTGAVDLFPVDIAESLGDEVVAVYGTSFNGIEVRANMNAFGYNTQTRLTQMTHEKIRAWVDLSDDQNWDSKIGFDPRAGLVQVENAVPRDPVKFERMNDSQWALGVQRGEEALSLPPGDTTHIRSPAN